MTKGEQILIQRYIDNELNVSDKQKVEDLINNNPGAKKYFEDLQSVNNALLEVNEDDKEVDLKDKIMAQINNINTQKVYTMNQHSVSKRLLPNVRWRIAYAFIIGLIVGAVVVAVVPRHDKINDVPESQLRGSISGNIGSEMVSVPVDLPGINLTIKADKLKEDYYKIVLDVFTEEQGMVNLYFNKSAFYLQSIQMLRENTDCRITTNRASAQMYNRGDNVYVLLIKKLNYLEEEISLQVYLDEMLKYENSFTLK